ncbi:MAG: 23S rRNA (uracil(1939)-C(5))-methyltransferase RlmD [Furfurilactobacillus sp.]|jgi:23S rRNA (uracil1939-C5)-methyltransferase|uniref:23S rRNA (Uracil(1939)-C(5))-methyltransferase RlmD n=1 Tax=Furfurilactobacillus milii TaxID=2888272 RepID=A0ABT6D9K6_9LACO|nr:MULTISPECIES: 23S rRNA (uracil(1939)-C(5))-methyltransferase RlmD [Furfurilactobacillus]QLE66116.1 RNA methyltransferase TrmA [Furfurilactobacillus rossiae]MCF6160785.1 23S rRNA (uracil(1939)-C(5))-methyltransferase RlmD [Furfurilactobacillus milii]MCF6163021.1 23S rRNA (uracil(1939)-C(5))-methyltransferase RlmD [Furfurilactobacillus milii]MCF6419730.1 23S rRNA (uracil(1939)-C(5))-methyltransferase RlmD [Furfurilactobacillus milii]MCH4012634.1 23S rRNA (uracil(1939)-C(5))-methyltransferase 
MKFKAPVAKNQEYTGDIIDLTYQGMGVAKIEDFPIFITNALPNEKVVFAVTKVAKTYAFGRVVKFIEKSPQRVDSVNVTYTQTGIAPLQHLSYEGQLAFKQHQVVELLKKSHLDIDVAKTVGMETPYHYRNKAQVPVREINGQIETGFYKRGSHTVVPIEDFYIQDPKIDEAIIVVRDLLRRFHLDAYDETNNTGVIKTIMVRRGYYSHEMMIVIVTRTHKLSMVNELVAEITKALPEVKSIIQNVNPQQTNVLLGDTDRIHFGSPVIHDQLMGLTFEISAHSFYQVNPQQTEKLYQFAIDKAQLTGEETVIDAYCGIGTISLAVAKHAKHVYGVEMVKTAISDAKTNANLNHIDNVDFVVGKAENQMARWQEAGLKADVIMVDPPRKGLAPEFIEAATAVKPSRVVYVSCNPATLVRDIQVFMDHGYHVDGDIQPVDQFPQTTSIECVVSLVKD